MKKILVTGGAGFIGSHTVDLLLENDYKVLVYDNFTTGKLSNLNLFHSQLEIIQGDILDYPKLSKEIARCDAVIHLAALSSVPRSIEDPVESLKINSLGFLNILQGMRAMPKPMRLVYASSAAVYGQMEHLPALDDVHLSTPTLSPYALQKAENEKYADLYLRLFDLPGIGLRYFNVYGPRQDPASPYSGVISKFIEQYQKKEPITIHGNGEQSRDFIFVKEVAKANLLALEKDYCGVLNIATGIPETLNKLIQYIERAGGRVSEKEFFAVRAGDILNSYGCIKKAAAYLSFQSQISLEEGIGELLLG